MRVQHTGAKNACRGTPPLAWKISGTLGWTARTAVMTRSAYGRLNSANWSGDRWCAHESNSCTTCAQSPLECPGPTAQALRSIRQLSHLCV